MNLTEKQKQWIAWISMALVVTLISTFLGVKYPIPPQPPPFLPDEEVILGTTHFTSLAVQEILNLNDTDSTLTGAQTLTPAATFYEFTPTAILTLTLGTGSAEVGDFLVIQNSSAVTNVVIIDTGATQGGGNVTLGTNDPAMFIYSNSKWIEIASPDNS